MVCMSELAVSLAKPQCQAERSGRHGSFTEDCRVGDRRESQETIYGRLHLCMIFQDETFRISKFAVFSVIGIFLLYLRVGH